MSKFLKFLVNLFLICSILVTASLLIPPLAGVTTNIIDTVNMDTNLPFGSVTYSNDVTTAELAEGNKVLVDSGNSIYVYTVQSGDASTGDFTVLDAMDKSSQASQIKLRNPVSKVILTVPYTGYVVVAMQSAEGFIIIILVLVFVAILFILSELWKKSDEEEEEEEEDDARETRRERKARLKAEKEARKAAEREAAEAEKAAKKSGGKKAEAEPAPKPAAATAEPAARGDFSEIGGEGTASSTADKAGTAGGDFSELPEDDVKIYTPKKAAAAALAGGAAAAAVAASGSSFAEDNGAPAELPSEDRRASQNVDGAGLFPEEYREARNTGADAASSAGLFPEDKAGQASGADAASPAGLFPEDKAGQASGADAVSPAGLFPEDHRAGQIAGLSAAESARLFPEDQKKAKVGEEGGYASLFPEDQKKVKSGEDGAYASLFPEDQKKAKTGGDGGYASLFPEDKAARPAGAEERPGSLFGDVQVEEPAAPDAAEISQETPVPAEEPVVTAAEMPEEAPAENAGPEDEDLRAAGLEPETAAPQDPDHFTPVDRPTLEEIVDQAKKKGLNPEIRRDSITNVHLVDFSELL